MSSEATTDDAKLQSPKETKKASCPTLEDILASRHWEEAKETADALDGPAINSKPEETSATWDKIRDGALRVAKKLDLATITDLLEMSELHMWGIYEMPHADYLSIVACLVYLASPMDAIPDWIPIIGLSDDAAMLNHTLVKLKGRRQQFVKWKNADQGRYERAQTQKVENRRLKIDKVRAMARATGDRCPCSIL